jgi:hypothetical protein
LHDEFKAEQLSQLQNIPENASNMYFSEKTFSFAESDLTSKVIRYTTSNPIKQEGLKTWFSELNHDREKNLLTGYLNLGVSVANLYNAKLSFE